MRPAIGLSSSEEYRKSRTDVVRKQSSARVTARTDRWRTRAPALCGGLIHDLVRTADIVWRWGDVAPGRVTGLVEYRFRTPAAGNAATIWSVNGANRDLFSLPVAPQRPASRSGAPGSPPFKTLAKKSGGQLQDKSLHDNAIVRRGVAKTPVGVEDQPQSGLELRLAEIRCRLIDLLGA